MEDVPKVGGVVNQVSYRRGVHFYASVCRSFQDLLVVQISHKLTRYWACSGILCHMALLGVKGLRGWYSILDIDQIQCLVLFPYTMLSLITGWIKGKVGKVAFEPREEHTTEALLGFCSMKQLRVFLLPTGWDAYASQGYPSTMALLSLYTTQWRDTGEQCCFRKQRDGRYLASNHQPIWSPTRYPIRLWLVRITWQAKEPHSFYPPPPKRKRNVQ